VRAAKASTIKGGTMINQDMTLAEIERVLFYAGLSIKKVMLVRSTYFAELEISAAHRADDRATVSGRGTSLADAIESARQNLEREEECPGPDQGDAENGPPDSIEPCCAKHFPQFFADQSAPPHDAATATGMYDAW
jgi:hypothetical protein